MAGKPTYEELEQRVKELDAEVDRHHQLEKNLRETEARFLAFMDNLPAVAYIKNESGPASIYTATRPFSINLACLRTSSSGQRLETSFRPMKQRK
jgi:hypothetical protein